ncbi:MAG TPA: OsmC family peroxiredoxin [Polyangiaceae bacterium]|jgi:osmotically inducible protein OsmC|nr:OsmC family peroxiredoxin [Polyangiaceae bacterium]
MATSKATAVWNGTLKEGAGTMKGGSGFFDAPFSFLSRFEGSTNGTNPEELIGAAHAGCFSMFLAAQLTNAGHPPTSIETKATVHLGAGPTVTKIELETVAKVPGVDQKLFDEKLAFTKANCPISKALASVPEFTVNATLNP